MHVKGSSFLISILAVSAILIVPCGKGSECGPRAAESAIPSALDSGAELKYQLSRPMRVSINLYDAEGELVRSLLCGAARQAGGQREFWDGLDQDGNPLPPGEYSWKLLAMPGAPEDRISSPRGGRKRGHSTFSSASPLFGACRKAE